MAMKQDLIKIVGRANVKQDKKNLKAYSSDESFVNPVRPSCVVKPGNLDEVQRIVRWANETETPLVPVSSGQPRFRGDTVPSAGGAVIVDMSRMKQIVRVDRRNRVAMVEPGVTFGELIPELAKEDLAPLLPLAPRQSKSVVGSVLEREPMTMPRYHWESQDPLFCIEVVFGTGDLFRTGDAAGPGTLEEQWAAGKAQCRPMGPSFTDFAKIVQGSQGTMGIVTWVSLKCRPLPKLKKSFLVPAENLAELNDLVYALQWKKLGQECFIVDKQNLASLSSEKGRDIGRLCKALPPWILIFSSEGFGLLPEKRLNYEEGQFKAVTQSLGLEPKSVLSGIRNTQVTEILTQPSKEPYWKMRAKGACHDIFFLTTLDRTPDFIAKMQELCSVFEYPSSDMGVYLQPTVQGVNCHCEFNLRYDPQSQIEKDKVKRLDSEAAKALSHMGAFFSRPYGHWTDYAYGNARTTVSVQRKVKAMFDPKGIMNPGKLCF